MYSPVYRQPQTMDTVQRWSAEAGLADIELKPVTMKLMPKANAATDRWIARSHRRSSAAAIFPGARCLT